LAPAVAEAPAPAVAEAPAPAVAEAPAPAVAEAPAPAVAEEKPAAAEEAAPAEVAKEEAAPVGDEGFKGLDAPNGEADDLKKITGVGPVLEKKLNELGIFHFSQIAAFTSSEIAQVDEVLNFKGRIERDGWLDQAEELAKG
ncbi:MAG: hypothetical protein ACR2OJ_13185, partial [Hyphomicrobiales bacterium]